MMGRQVAKVTYWLGAALAVLALLTRVFNIFGMNFLALSTRGNTIGYRTYLDGAVFFLVISIATANYAMLNSGQHQP
jgi:hypothetical protein